LGVEEVVVVVDDESWGFDLREVRLEVVVGGEMIVEIVGCFKIGKLVGEFVEECFCGLGLW